MQLVHTMTIFFAILATFSGFADEVMDFDAEDNFHQGQIFYKEGAFDAAVDKFSKAISLSPDTSRYHHWLAKTYGELAEISGWIKAIKLAEDSKDSLERAVELDPKNIAALTDLMKYYREAPSFLGGSDEKAREISIRLEKLKEKNTRSFNNHHVTSRKQYS